MGLVPTREDRVVFGETQITYNECNTLECTICNYLSLVLTDNATPRRAPISPRNCYTLLLCICKPNFGFHRIVEVSVLIFCTKSY